MKAGWFRRHSLAWISTLALVAGTGLTAGQTPRDTLEVLRGDLKADRKAYIADAMALTPQESEAFWPIYRSYRAEVDTITDGIIKLVLQYADLYPVVPEEKAKELLKEYTKAETDLVSIKKKYLKKFQDAVPASKVFRFAQLDNRFDLGVRLAVAASVPLMPQNTGANPSVSSNP